MAIALEMKPFLLFSSPVICLCNSGNGKLSGNPLLKLMKVLPFKTSDHILDHGKFLPIKRNVCLLFTKVLSVICTYGL